MKSAAQELMVPFSEVNATLVQLNKTKIECDQAVREKEAVEGKLEAVREELRQARGRVDLLLGGLRDVGKSVGVGGIGGIMALVMSDEDLISETKEKVRRK